MRTVKEAFLTVEAAVIFPILIYAMAVFVYMVIFAYDKTMLSQDTYLMTIYSLEAYRNSSTDYLKEVDKQFSLIKKEHPYISINDISMSISKKNNKISLMGEVIFYAPFDSLVPDWFPIGNKEICSKKSISLADPVEIMLFCSDLTRE